MLVRGGSRVQDCFHFVVFVFAFYNCRGWLGVIWSVFLGDGVGCEERIVEHRVDAPMSGQLES